jgi:hypothetical protein
MGPFKEGKQAGSAFFVTSLTGWVDNHGVLHLRFPDGSGESGENNADFSKPGTLHITFLDNRKPVWNATAKWPGEDATGLPLASARKSSERGVDALKRQLAALGPALEALAPERMPSRADAESAMAGQCPDLSEFPFMDAILGRTRIQMGKRHEQVEAELESLGEKDTRGDQVIYDVKLPDGVGFDVSAVKFRIEEGVLRRCTIIYQVAPIGNVEASKLVGDLRRLLGSISGFVENAEKRRYAAWFKRDTAITINYVEILKWYMVEIYRKEGGIDLKTKGR